MSNYVFKYGGEAACEQYAHALDAIGLSEPEQASEMLRFDQAERALLMQERIVDALERLHTDLSNIEHNQRAQR